jgi:hypothetical protein
MAVFYGLDKVRTPVPLSTTRGRSESMVELKKPLFVMLCSSLSTQIHGLLVLLTTRRSEVK